MNEEHKQKLTEARARAREARKNAVEAEITEASSYESPPPEGLDEVSALKAELAALKNKHREKAAHEHETISGREKIFDQSAGGAQEDVRASLREMLREELAETFPERQPVRKTTRESVRPGAVVAQDRDGNPIYRKRDSTKDKFDIPEELKESGWDYMWSRVSVHGWEDLGTQVNHQENGWRFVPADRPGWAGKFMPAGYRGNIYQDGLALMERPMVLTEEAKREATELVRQQSFAQRQQFGLRLPDGFSSQTESARANTFARTGQREAVPETLKPNLRPALDID